MSDPRSLFAVDDLVVLISGGSRGIGRALADALAEAGARVVVSARSADELAATGHDYLTCDVTESAQVRDCAATVVHRYGRIDALLNVAGVNFRHAAETFPDDALDRILDVNVRGNYLMARECGRAMIGQGRGKIVNIASLYTHLSLPGVSAYGVSKGSIGSLTRALAVEWAPFGIGVNAIAPGFIRTELNAELWADAEIREWAEGRTPAARLGETDDLVGAALFLVSRGSDFVTGQVLYVDGGISAGSAWPLVVPGRTA